MRRFLRRGSTGGDPSAVAPRDAGEDDAAESAEEAEGAGGAEQDDATEAAGAEPAAAGSDRDAAAEADAAAERSGAGADEQAAVEDEGVVAERYAAAEQAAAGVEADTVEAAELDRGAAPDPAAGGAPDAELAALLAPGAGWAAASVPAPDDERAAEGGPAAPGASDLALEPAWEPEPDPWPDPMADGRPAALRVARLHLRTGQHALARAELEALAGLGRLDEDALLDLAEVRWRTGDLAGAGEAANTLLARGGEPALALVIAAEAVAALGRPGEARRLSSRALEAIGGPLDPVFAGMPRAMIWPPAGSSAPAPGPPRSARRSSAESDGAPTTASEAFAGGRAALARNDAGRAALLLGVAMRLEPDFAQDVLRAVSGRDDQPLLALVRGDALRLLGREAEALESFDRARGRSSAALGTADRHGGPGLFDGDPAVMDDDTR
jgi:hypothetical protein